MDEMSREELLRRRLWGQFFTRKGTPLEVAGGLCGLQAQYAANALHALRSGAAERRSAPSLA